MNNDFRLTTEPLQFVRYEVCTLHSELNEHSVLTLQGIIDEQQVPSFLLGEQLCVLHYQNEDVELVWHGIVKETTLSKSAGQVVAHVKVVGKTCLADDLSVTRTYNGEQQSLQQLVKQMQDPKIPKLYGEKANESLYASYSIQYEETNWQFLKRQAIKKQIPLIVEEMDGYLEIFTDVQEQARPYELGVHDYIAMKEKTATLFTRPIANKTKQQQFETVIYSIGEKLHIEGIDYIVCAKTYELHRLQSLQIQYELKVESALFTETVVHPLAQQTVQATIIHTNDAEHLGRVAVCFPWEQEQEVQARLYPWATPFSANDIGFHALPEPGERVYVLFRTREETDAFVYLAERTKRNDQLTNTQQYWRTAQGVEILLGEQLVKLSIPDEKQSAFTLQQQEMRLHFQNREVTLTPEKIIVTDEKNRIVLTAAGIELLTGEQSVRLKQQELELQSGQQRLLMKSEGIVLQATNIDLQATNKVSINGQAVQLNTDQASVKATDMLFDTSKMELKAKSKLELTSGKVNIKSRDVSIG